MHSSIKLDTPIEVLNIKPLNPLISKCEIKVCYVGEDPNRNGSIITKEVATEMANSLPGSPIVGYYNEEDQDFEGHNRELVIEDGEFKIKDTTRPYGFVDLNATVWFQKFLDDGVNEHEYLMTEGYLWTGQYPECARILEKGNNQSMELDEKNVKGEWTKPSNNKPQMFIINEAIISKLCILGEDTEPCFEGARVTSPTIQFSFENGFKEQLFSMMNELKEYLEGKGGEEPMPIENMEVETEVIEETVEVEAETEVAIEFEETSPESVPQTEEFSKNEDENDSEDKSDSEKDSEEKCPECGKPVDECECEEEKEEECKYSLEEIPEYVELSTNYSTLQEQYENLQATVAELNSQIESLTEFKKGVEKKEKEAMIDSFYMLSDEDKQDIRNNIDSYSIDEIESKLSVICVRNKVSFSLSEDDNNGPTTYNLNGSGEEDVSTPAWVKAARAVAKTME